MKTNGRDRIKNIKEQRRIFQHTLSLHDNRNMRGQVIIINLVTNQFWKLLENHTPSEALFLLQETVMKLINWYYLQLVFTIFWMLSTVFQNGDHRHVFDFWAPDIITWTQISGSKGSTGIHFLTGQNVTNDLLIQIESLLILLFVKRWSDLMRVLAFVTFIFINSCSVWLSRTVLIFYSFQALYKYIASPRNLCSE